jgi:hypothetical protein
MPILVNSSSVRYIILYSSFYIQWTSLVCQLVLNKSARLGGNNYDSFETKWSVLKLLKLECDKSNGL